MRLVVAEVLNGSETNRCFDEPRDVAVCADGSVNIVDTGNKRLVRYADGQATEVDLSYSKAVGPGGLALGDIGEASYPHAIATDRRGRILVSLVREGGGWAGDLSEHIVVLSPELEVLGRFGRRSETNTIGAVGTFARVTGIAVSAVGEVYVADEYNFRVQVFSIIPDGELGLSARPKTWWPVGDSAYPSDVFLSSGKVAVSERMEPRVHWFTPDGQPAGITAVKGSDRWDSLTELSCIGCLPSGHLVGMDKRNSSLIVHAEDGTFAGKLGGPGGQPGKFLGPEGLDVSPDGTIYVADTGNHRVQVVRIES